MQLALDDPVALRKLLTDCAVPAPVVANLDLSGYKTVALLGYSIHSDSQLDELISKIISHELGETLTSFHLVQPV